jgi:hypothetical protein
MHKEETDLHGRVLVATEIVVTVKDRDLNMTRE